MKIGTCSRCGELKAIFNLSRMLCRPCYQGLWRAGQLKNVRGYVSRGLTKDKR